MSDHITEEQRKAFERWAASEHLSIERTNPAESHGDYMSIVVELCWQAWSVRSSRIVELEALVTIAFDLGYAWRADLIGQNLEDSRAVGRTLLSDRFIEAGLTIGLEDWDSFTSADIAICEGKRRIKAALTSRLRAASSEAVTR